MHGEGFKKWVSVDSYPRRKLMTFWWKIKIQFLYFPQRIVLVDEGPAVPAIAISHSSSPVPVLQETVPELDISQGVEIYIIASENGLLANWERGTPRCASERTYWSSQFIVVPREAMINCGNNISSIWRFVKASSRQGVPSKRSTIAPQFTQRWWRENSRCQLSHCLHLRRHQT